MSHVGLRYGVVHAERGLLAYRKTHVKEMSSNFWMRVLSVSLNPQVTA